MTPSEIKPEMVFGNWEVIKFHHTNKHRIKYFLCRCKVCGKYKPVRGTSLIDGTSTACSPQCKNNLIGQEFGRWKVIAKDKSRPRYWVCKCQCGTVRSIHYGKLKNGLTKQCGCVYQPQLPHIINPIVDNEEAKEQMKEILDKNNIKFKVSVRFEDCANNSPIPFDFGIYNTIDELIGLIDLKGIILFASCGTGWDTPDRLLYQQKHDYMKRSFAEANTIPYLVIPYQYFNDLEKFLITSDFWQIIQIKPSTTT